jgi:hypothetical protein|tara:strand:+ start:2761 stop:3030 length:270 start_codon:yes stop_codon:yes gene_type:complete
MNNIPIKKFKILQSIPAGNLENNDGVLSIHELIIGKYTKHLRTKYITLLAPTTIINGEEEGEGLMVYEGANYDESQKHFKQMKKMLKIK